MKGNVTVTTGQERRKGKTGGYYENRLYSTQFWQANTPG
jgi:hypothetical protein